MDTYQSTKSRLCGRCSALVISSWPPNGAYDLQRMKSMQGRIGRGAPILDFELEDTYPQFPVLIDGQRMNCAFCGLLRDYLLDEVRKRLQDESDGYTKAKDEQIHVVVKDLRYWYEQTLEKKPEESGEEQVRNALSYLTGNISVRCESGTWKTSWSLHFTVCGADDDDATEHLQIDERPSVESSFAKTNIERMKHWLQECRCEHVRCEQVIRSQTDLVSTTLQQHKSMDPGFVPTRLLDVFGGGCSKDHVRLRDTSDKPESYYFRSYAALSYCWGDSAKYPALKTYTHNIDEHMQGILLESLPKTICDAVVVARELDIRYLWVDALCIVQDDNEDWQKEAARMMHVYANAVVTLAAVYGDHGHAGLFPQRKCAPSVRIPFQALDERTGRPAIGSYTLEAEDRQALGSRPDISYHTDVDIREWNKRAWTYQERALSTRTLIFGQNLRFECQQVHYSSITRDPRYRQMHFKSSSVHRLEQHEKSAQAAYDFWINAVEDYSGRKLTYETDRLVAISGIVHMIAKNGGDQYLAGIWRGDLTRGLLWLTPTIKSNKSQYVAPSWSWASISERVQWIRTRGTDDAIEAYKLIDAGTTLAGLDAMGAVSGGFLTISGQVKHFQNTTHFGEKCGKLTWPTFDSIVERVGESEAIFALPLIRRPGRDGYRQIQGLILCGHEEQASRGQNKYTRIGMFLMDTSSGHDVGCFDGCRAEEVTIV